jgi:hypothetical protein
MKMRRSGGSLATVLLSTLALGCGSKGGDSHDGAASDGPGDGASDSADQRVAEQDSAGAEAAAPADAVGKDGPQADRAASDAAGDGPAAAPRPQEVPSRQTVTFMLQNETAADLFVVTKGHLCEPFSVWPVSDAGAAALRLVGGIWVEPVTATSVSCEGVSPGLGQFAGLHRLKPGEAYSVRWDARALVTSKVTLPCIQPQYGSQTVEVGALQPVSPGPYRATLAIATMVPGLGGGFPSPSAPACRAHPGSTDDFDCTYFPNGIPMAGLCPSDHPQSVSFTLPERGDLTVMVPVR